MAACMPHVALLAILLLSVLSAARLPAQLSPGGAPKPASDSRTFSSSAAPDALRDILVLYYLSSHDTLGKDNLEYFLMAAVDDDQRCQLLLLLPSDQADMRNLPKAPSNAHVLQYGAALDKWSAYTWALQHLQAASAGLPAANTSSMHSHAVDLPAAFNYYFLIDSSVRGPFVPPMLKGLIPWWHPFVAKLTSLPGSELDRSAPRGSGDARRIALVGSTIICEASIEDLQEDRAVGKGGAAPHVQLRAAAMTAATMQLLLERRVFDTGMQALAIGSTASQAQEVDQEEQQVQQHMDDELAQHHQLTSDGPQDVEVEASGAVLAAGGTLDCLMLRYAGIDWHQHHNWGCNARLAPDGEFAYDGVQLDPYEVLFVSMNKLRLQQRHPAAIAAEKYRAWLHPTNTSHSVVGNQYLDETPRFKLPKILEKLTQGSQCFDFDFYLDQNDDVRKSVQQDGSTLQDVWEFFVYYGQFEPREFRFTCPMDYQQFAGFSLKLHQRLLATTHN